MRKFVVCLTYLGSKINNTGGTEQDTKARIQKVLAEQVADAIH